MRLAALIAALALGAGAGVARADHDGERRAYETYRLKDRAHRDTMWVQLAPRMTSTHRGHEIAIPPGTGALRTIRVSADHGSIRLKRVVIDFANGARQNVKLDRFLSAGQSAFVDLPGQVRKVRRVIVFTAPAHGTYTAGVFTVYGARPQPQYGFEVPYRRPNPYNRY